MLNLKIKPLTKDQIIISIDRLTRFKNPEVKYLRVFKDIVISNLINPKFKKSDLDKLNYSELKNLAEKIINYSLEALDVNIKADYSINKKLLEYEKSIFEIDQDTQNLIDNKINYNACINLIDKNCVKNLQWLNFLSFDNDIRKLRKQHMFHFPIEKIVLAEGATEEILLPEFAKLCDYDFDGEGVHLIAAGGKNQVVKLYYELSETLQIPIFILLDKDGMNNAQEMSSKLRSIDKIHIIECGEFEDLLPEELLKRSINCALGSISVLENLILDKKVSRVKFLEEIFKHRGMHEFKKAEFARIVKSNIIGKQDISPEINKIIEDIKKLSK
ncbi:ATP-dependent endonuclease [bacterium]|nr:ATP-dependent endonuclease [bacterium]